MPDKKSAPGNAAARYRKNYFLIGFFIVLLTLAMGIALYLGYRLTQRYIEGRFVAGKSEVLDETIKPYNTLVFKKIPQLSLYQGFLDSVSVDDYAASIFRVYPFVDSLSFYNVEISNHLINDGFRSDKFSVGVDYMKNFDRKRSPRYIFIRNKAGEFDLQHATEFSNSLLKFVSFIASARKEPMKPINSEQEFNLFYTFTKNRISYLNIPRLPELRIYADLMFREQAPSAIYDQDMVSLFLNPQKLMIKNALPDLYENVLVTSLNFDSLSTNKSYSTTGVALPGAFSDYQLYFISSKEFMARRILSFFLPIASIIVSIYILLVFIAFLIYRNLNINSKLFKLQYDFVNNLTHEFKTPVSVIKIAGSNIRSSTGMKVEEMQLYGKILNEEADKLNELMNKLLSFTQIENRSIALKPERVDLEEFIQALVDACRIKYPDFKVSYMVEGVHTIVTDETLLFSIFQNLIDNAYKYSPADNKVLEIKAIGLKKFVVIHFIDEGIGIPPTEVDNIFKKFYRIENEFNRNGSVGIGLAFCKEVVNFMNGDIRVKSKVGKGSEFRLTLPIDLNS